jgi:hypothetical protein
MSLNRSIQKFNKKITDPLGGINKLGDKWGLQDMTDLYREGPLGNASGWKQAAASKGGSIMSGRMFQEGKIEERPDNGHTGEMRTLDVFGSPATAGTGAQSTARVGAIIYGLGALGMAAMGGGAAGGGGGAAGSGAGAGGAGLSAPAGGTTSGATAGAGSSGATTSPGWYDYYSQYSQAAPPQQQEQEPYQPQESTDYGEQDQEAQYWSNRGMQLRLMADQAVRRYLN